MNTLPDKPSDLLEVALRDLEAVEQDPKYRVRMDVWHEPAKHINDPCQVCLAGAVMAKSLETSNLVRRWPCDFSDKDTLRKLRALDDMRVGAVSEALERLDLPPVSKYDFVAHHYGANPEGFKRDLRNLVDKLRKDGL
jgi:hypothetical protein